MWTRPTIPWALTCDGPKTRQNIFDAIQDANIAREGPESSNRTITITGIIVCVFVGLGFLCGGYGINKHDDLAGLICCTVLNMGIITIGTIIILVFAVKGRNLLDVKIQALD